MKKKAPLIISALLLVAALVVYLNMGYGWFAVADRATPMKFSFASINSEVYFYTARDSSLNGVPDLLRDGDSPATDETEAQKPDYYAETRWFDFNEMKLARADELAETVSFGKRTSVVPTEILTFKLSIVNRGDSPNKLSLVVGGRELTGKAALVYATLAVRVCRVVSADGSNTPDSAPSVEVGEWFYLCDVCTLAEGVASFGSVTPFGDYSLPGVEESATSGDTSGATSGTGAVENVCDLWLQVEMLPYAELEQNEKFKALNITEAQYQAMQGMDNAFELNFSVLFEVDV